MATSVAVDEPACEFSGGDDGERVRAGLGEARRNGKRIARPPIQALTTEERTRIRKEHSKGKSLRKLADAYGVTLWTAHSACRAGGDCGT